MAFPLINPRPDYSPSGTLEFRNPSTNVYVNTYPTADDADAGTNANDNPIILDSAGRASIYLPDSTSVRVIHKDEDGTTVWTEDDVVTPVGAAYLFGTYTYTPAGGTARTLQSKLDDVVSLGDFGVVGDGVTDDTAELQLFLTACANKYGFVPDNSMTFRITALVTIPDNAVIDFNGSTISIEYTSTSTVCVKGQADTILNDLNIVVPTGFVVDRAINFGARSKGTNIKVTSTDQQNNRDNTLDGAVRAVGDGAKLSGIHIENFDNGVVSSGYDNIDMDHIYIKNYVRGLYINSGDYCSLAHYICHGLSANGLPDPGHNGLLVSDMRYSSFDDLHIHNAGEHGIRVSGLIAANNLTFSSVQVEKPGQCGLKIFGSVRIKDISINGLHVTDCSSGGASGSNEDGFRAQLADHVTLTGYSCVKRDNIGTSTYDGIYLENCTDITIVSPYIADAKNHGIHITDGGVAADVQRIFITSPQIFNTVDGDSVQIDVSTTGSTLQDVRINDLYTRQAGNYTLEIDSTDAIITGPVIVTGYAKAGTAGMLNEVTAIADTQYVTAITTVS